VAGLPGLREVYTLRDVENDVLMGLAIWDTEEAWRAAISIAREAVKGDNFDDWEDQPPLVYHFEAV
jgi:hypothetical protein